MRRKDVLRILIIGLCVAIALTGTDPPALM